VAEEQSDDEIKLALSLTTVPAANLVLAFAKEACQQALVSRDIYSRIKKGAEIPLVTELA
jgi:hypothetical protein